VIETVQSPNSAGEHCFDRHAKLAVHFAEVTAQQETEAVDGDLSTANPILGCCQYTLEGAKAAATELERKENLDEYL